MPVDAEARRYLEALVEGLASLLGPRLVGAYLIGSGAFGDYVPGRSDLDVLVVSSSSLPIADRERVVQRLSHDALPCPAAKLELVVYPVPSLTAPAPSLDWDVNLNTGEGLPLHASFRPETEPRHWFVLDVAAARGHGRVLVGPEPSAVLPPIARPTVLEALRESLSWHRRHDPAGVQTVLNGCRAWRFVEEGAWGSKTEAARWALERTTDPALVETALAARLDDTGTETVEAGRAARFLDELDERLRRALARG